MSFAEAIAKIEALIEENKREGELLEDVRNDLLAGRDGLPSFLAGEKT